MSIRDEGIQRLNKLEPIYVLYIREWPKELYRNAEYWILYNEKGVVKYALISDPYYKRYGPSVIATLKSDSPTGFWQNRKDAITDEIYKEMLKFFKKGHLDRPLLEPDTLTYEA